jgi:hypothetical protein
MAVEPARTPAARHTDNLSAVAAHGGSPSSTAPLALWLGLQLAAVLVAVVRVPLAAQYPEPAEQMAAYLVTGTQGVAAALIFPFLLRSARTTVQVIASTWPFLLAAGYLAGVAPKAMIWPAASITAWLVTLALWASILRTTRAQMVGITIASLLTLGGGLLRYLRLEFAAGTAEPGFALETASPLLSTFAALDGSPSPAGWILLASLAFAAIAVRLFIQVKRARATATAGSTS